MDKDYWVGGVIAGFFGLLGGALQPLIPLMPFLRSLIMGVLAGKLTCTLVRKAVSRRRSETLNKVMIAAAIAGGILGNLNVIHTFFSLIGLLGKIPGGFSALGMELVSLLWVLLYIAVLVRTIFSDMNGMVFRR